MGDRPQAFSEMVSAFQKVQNDLALWNPNFLTTIETSIVGSYNVISLSELIFSTGISTTASQLQTINDRLS
jgi:hypothetical protein